MIVLRCRGPKVVLPSHPVQRKRIGQRVAFRLTPEHAEAVPREAEPFTPKQGQYLAFIYYYTKIHERPPSKAGFQRFFRVTRPVVHQMIKTLAARGYVDREPGTARSIRLRLTRAQLPDLDRQRLRGLLASARRNHERTGLSGRDGRK